MHKRVTASTTTQTALLPSDSFIPLARLNETQTITLFDAQKPYDYGHYSGVNIYSIPTGQIQEVTQTVRVEYNTMEIYKMEAVYNHELIHPIYTTKGSSFRIEFDIASIDLKPRTCTFHFFQGEAGFYKYLRSQTTLTEHAAFKKVTFTTGTEYGKTRQVIQFEIPEDGILFSTATMEGGVIFTTSISYDTQYIVPGALDEFWLGHVDGRVLLTGSVHSKCGLSQCDAS